MLGINGARRNRTTRAKVREEPTIRAKVGSTLGFLDRAKCRLTNVHEPLVHLQAA